jgi:hypothetical protein
VSVGDSHNERTSEQRNAVACGTNNDERHRTKSVALAEQM